MPALRTLSAALLLAFGLGACGGGGGGSSDGTDTTSSSGVLVDDRIADATLFCDSNGNGSLDEGEATTTSDDHGAFTFSPSCSAAIVTVAGTGYDKTLLKAPKSRLRAAAGSAVVSYFTTLQLDSGLSAEEFQAVMTKLGLSGVNPATFDPSQDNTERFGSAAALSKILNELAEIVENMGGDSQAAFRAAALALVEQARNLPSGSTVFTSDDTLGNLVQAAAAAAFATVDSSTWSDTAKANAAAIATDGLRLAAQVVRGHRNFDDAHDDLNNSSVGSIISETDLEDATRVSEARERCRDHNGENRRAQYVYTDGDAFTFVDGSDALRSFTLEQLDAGIDLSDTTLGALKRLELPLRATSLALSRHGQRVALGLSVEQTDGTRVMQVALDKVTLQRNSSTGVVSASVPSRAKLYFYAKSASGIEIGTGAAGFTDLNAELLSSTSTGLSIDLKVLAEKMKGRFPTQTALLDNLLQAKGNFKIKVVIGELDLRHADASRFGVGRVAVSIPDSHRSAYRVNGTAVNGRVTF